MIRQAEIEALKEILEENKDSEIKIARGFLEDIVDYFEKQPISYDVDKVFEEVKAGGKKRLIDMDEAITVIANHHFDSDKNDFDLLIHNLCKEIKQIPTAYDVDKVVKLLEEKENESVLKAPNTDDLHNPDYQKWMMKSYGFKEAKEIVKAGVLNE